ncbi:MAG: hypothetical protein Fur0037_10250 [Planctomycetota bacterium]
MTILPSAPRDVPFRTAMSLWWPLGLVASMLFAIATLGAAILLSIDGFRLPTWDSRLDGDAETVADAARIVAIEETGVRGGGRTLQRIRYRASIEGREFDGESFGWSGDFAVGMTAAVQFLPEDPSVQRLASAKVAMSSIWMPWFGGLLWLPSAALLGFWLTRVYRLHVLLRNGREAAVEFLSLERKPGVNPPQLVARYRFTSSDGRPREGSQWLSQSGSLAKRLSALELPARLDDVAVVYDEEKPERNRLLERKQCLSA